MIEIEPQALLITQKGRKSLVILPSESFDQLMMQNLSKLYELNSIK
jgi:PHD/YefM family antitoxin component YafN of YafNO toxin-antitoxin module